MKLGNIVVVNLHTYIKRGYPSEVFIGRGDIYGNPFSHLTQQTKAKWYRPTRDAACDAFEEWYLNSDDIEAKRARNGVRRLAFRVSQGGDLVLCCYCVPLRCHGTWLKERILEEAKKILDAEQKERDDAETYSDGREQHNAEWDVNH